MKQKVFNVLSSILNVPVESLSEGSSPDSIESWDSLKHIELILALEEEFKVYFSQDQIAMMSNVKNIFAALSETNAASKELI